jgi:hypothetical protein
MSKDTEPDWLAELAKGGEALQREAMRLVKAAEELAASGPARPLTRRIVRAVGASIRELAAPEPVAANVTVTAGLATASAVAMATAVGSVVLPPMRFAGEGTVQEPDLIVRTVGCIFALVLLWLVVLAVPAAVAATDLSPKVEAALDAYDAILAALALEITFRFLDKRNKR